MRIVFMGTPDFAAASLDALLKNGYNIAGVFTQPDKAKGRGMEISFSPVKELALENEIPVFQPAKMRDGAALSILQSLKPDLVVVVAYGRILPDDILSVPPLGTINVHGSLLPRYRGAAPIQWSVLNGDEKTGVTTMYLSSEMDAGDIIFSEETEIGEYETSGELYDRLKKLGAELLIKTVRAIEAGCAPRTPQDETQATLRVHRRMRRRRHMYPCWINRSLRLILQSLHARLLNGCAVCSPGLLLRPSSEVWC